MNNDKEQQGDLEFYKAEGKARDRSTSFDIAMIPMSTILRKAITWLNIHIQVISHSNNQFFWQNDKDLDEILALALERREREIKDDLEAAELQRHHNEEIESLSHKMEEMQANELIDYKLGVSADSIMYPDASDMLLLNTLCSCLYYCLVHEKYCLPICLPISIYTYPRNRYTHLQWCAFIDPSRFRDWIWRFTVWFATWERP